MVLLPWGCVVIAWTCEAARERTWLSLCETTEVAPSVEDVEEEVVCRAARDRLSTHYFHLREQGYGSCSRNMLGRSRILQQHRIISGPRLERFQEKDRSDPVAALHVATSRGSDRLPACRVRFLGLLVLPYGLRWRGLELSEEAAP
jgi:hypothetical protein